MICKNCGREIPDSSKFCFGCAIVNTVNPVNTVAPSEASRVQQPPDRMQESSEAPPTQAGGTPPVNGVGSVFPGFSSSQSDQAGYPINREYSPNTAYVSYPGSTGSADYTGKANK